MNNRNNYLILIVVILFLSHIILVSQIVILKRSIRFLESKIGIYENALNDSKEHLDLQIKTINEGISFLLFNQEEYKAEITKDLANIKQKSDSQFSKTVVMSKTYDAILEEQKNKTIDTAEKDKSYLEAKINALTLYNKKRYSDAYEQYKNLTIINSEDMECRLYKAKSLYYKNPGDSSSYSEILEDIKILKQNAKADNQILEIEKCIKAEKGGVNE